MIANFFNKTKPINFLVLSVLVFIIFLTALISKNSEPISLIFFFKNALFAFIAVLTVFVLNFIIRKNSLTEDNSYAIIFYILLCSYFLDIFLNVGIFLSNFILLLSFRRIYSLRSPFQPKEKIFDGAFWIGIASLFYVWSLMYLVLLYAAIVIFRKIDLRNFLIPIIGVMTPIFLSYTYLLAFDDLEMFRSLWDFSFNLDQAPYNVIYFLIPLILMGLMTLIAIYPTTKRSLLAKIDFKSTWTLLIAHILISMVVSLISPDKNGSELVFMFFPLSILFANYLQMINRYWLKELIIYLFIIAFTSQFF